MKKLILAAAVVLAGALGLQHFSGVDATEKRAAVKAENPDLSGLSVATFAGGCFWCVESSLEKLPGVKEVISGYSGGEVENPSYEMVSGGSTGHTEAVQVYYDPARISYEQLVAALWREIDPTDGGGQFSDRGRQYRPAIFYHSQEQKKTAEQSADELARSGRYDRPLAVEIVPFKSFYQAEPYHQDYYLKNPLRYSFYRSRSGRDRYLERTWGKDPQPAQGDPSPEAARYVKPADEELKKTLTPLQYEVTQNEGTEHPYQNEYWDEKRAGIYVDIVTGEPLFSSRDKYDSGTGWPSFTRPISHDYLVEKTDFKLILPRREVRSRFGDSHLGHVFDDGPAPDGQRYCVNSAALRFVPRDEMASQGYQKLLSLLE